jgi:serine-type D-Ala-D-Ala carboxypeptidase (penicillin-binding protein 5/6)
MTSVLQGGRRRRRPGARIARLLVLLAPLAVIAAIVVGSGHGGDPAPVQTPAVQTPPVRVEPEPGATPSPRTAAPDPAQAALTGVDAFHLSFKEPPRAGIVFDVRTGEVLWRRNPLKRTPIASLTKIMTALLVVERTHSRDEIRVPKDALNYIGSGVGLLPKGRHVTIEALLHGLLLPSGNDAAIALADGVAGSRAQFVALMNEKAQTLGLRCTHFASPSGINDRDRSCAADLAALTRIVLAKRRIARIVRKTHAAVRFPIKGGKLYLNNTNPLLRMRYPGTLGLKTGDTLKAGHCLIAVVHRGGRTLAAIVLHSPNPQLQVRRLFAKAFHV